MGYEEHTAVTLMWHESATDSIRNGPVGGVTHHEGKLQCLT